MNEQIKLLSIYTRLCSTADQQRDRMGSTVHFLILHIVFSSSSRSSIKEDGLPFPA